jgi:RNA polymerase sigma factor (sigma-70 family)
MVSSSLAAVMHQVRAWGDEELPDGRLLERFVSGGDEAAFAMLLRRHGRLVLSVCRRILGPGPDIDDVFQAAFLVLARKAAGIRKQASVASWLYGVAYRLAVRVKARRQRRARREQNASLHQLAETQAMHADSRASLRELGTILDEELQRLPAGYREALVLCFMEGLSHTQAAQQLGCPLGTLKGRLRRGRDALHQRLERRGVALSTVGLTVILSDQCRAAVPAALTRAALQIALNKTTSPAVAALAQEAVRALTATKAPLVALVALVAALCGFAFAMQPASQAAAEGDVAPAMKAPIQSKDKDNTDVFGDALPPSALARLGTVRWRHGAPIYFLALRDGKTAVSAANDRYVRVWDLATGKEQRRFGPGPQANVYTGGSLVLGRVQEAVAAASPDGTMLATQFDEPAVDLWDIASGKKLGTIPLAKTDFDVVALTFAPDARQLAMCSRKGKIRLWDIAAARVVREFAQAERTLIFHHTLLYAPDGKTLVSIHPEMIDGGIIPHLHVWDVESGNHLRVHKITGPNPIVTAAISPDSKLIAYGSGGEICLVKTRSGEQVRKWASSSLQELGLLGSARVGPPLVFAADGTKLFSKSRDEHAICEWDVATGKLLRRLAGGEFAGTLTYPIPGMQGELTLSADGKRLALGGEGNTIRLVDIETGKDLVTGGGHVDGLRHLHFAADGKSLLTVADGTLRHWDAATGKELKQRPARDYGFVLSADGRYTAAVNDRGGITVRDQASAAKVANIPGPDQGPGFVDFSFSPDGRILLVRSIDHKYAILFELPSGKERCRVPLPDGTVDIGGELVRMAEASFYFAPDGRRLAVHMRKNPLAIHDTATGKRLAEIELADTMGFNNLAFTPDGRTAAIDCGDGVVQLIELATGQERRRFGKKHPPRDPRSAGVVRPRAEPEPKIGTDTVAFSPDGRLLALAGVDQAVYVWDVATGKMLARFDGHQGSISAIAFSPDGSRLASGSTDTTALVWDTSGLVVKPAPRQLDADALQSMWNDLTADSPVAADAINALVASPKEAVAICKMHLKRVEPVESAAIEKLIKDLDSPTFKVREKANAELLAIGEQVVPYLETALKDKNRLEVQQRLEKLHGKLTAPLLTGERLRQVRATEVLERISNTEAREVLADLAAGAPEALITSQARGALDRLKSVSSAR